MMSRQSSKKQSQQTFILEPILTRSGLIDGTDDFLDTENLPIDLLNGENEESVAEFTVSELTGDDGTKVLTTNDGLNESVVDNPIRDRVSNSDTILDDSGRLEGVFTVGETGEVTVDFLFDGGGYQGELAVFSLEGMEEFAPGSTAFIREAASRALSDSDLGYVVIRDPVEGAAFSGELGEGNRNLGEYLGAKTFKMRPGDEFGLMLVPNGTVEQVWDNPDSQGAIRPLFSLATANPEDGFHVGQIADVTGNGHTFVMEDLRVDEWTDKDYNDLIFQVTGATGKAVDLDTVINPDADWRTTELGQAILTHAESAYQVSLLPEIPEPGTIEFIGEIDDITLTPQQPTATIDLATVFADTGESPLQFEIVTGDGNAVAIALDNSTLHLTAGTENWSGSLAIRALNPAGDSLTHQFTVTTSQLTPESTQIFNDSLTELNGILAAHSGDLIAGLDSLEDDSVILQLETLVDENPSILNLISQPESLAKMGVTADTTQLRQVLENPELAREMGLPVSLGEALSQPDQGAMDLFLTNAQDAIGLLPENTPQPPVGFVDFTQGHHINRVIDTFATVNPVADYQTLVVSNGNWHTQVVQFVNQIKASDQPQGVLNLSLDLSQLDDVGETTRYELTIAEQEAIRYAQEHNVLLVVSAGNTGGQLSALGAASQRFDNIITVGAVNQFESKTDYSGYGDGLTLMAPGGQWQDDPTAFVGTSKSTAYVTAAASLVWAANPGLSYAQVKRLLLETAVDLETPGWDEKTGFGAVDIKEAMSRAVLTAPETSLSNSSDLPLTSFSGKGRVFTLARPTSETTETAIQSLAAVQETLLNQWQVLAELGNPSLSLTELEAEVKAKINTAFTQYQQVSTAAEISRSQAQNWVDALTLATNHYQIEVSRLNALLTQQQELETELTELGTQKAALETETQELLASIRQEIARAEADLAKAKAKLLNPFADVDDNLQTNPQSWQEAANQAAQTAQTFQAQAAIQGAEAERYQAIADSINPQRWQVVKTERDRSGRTKQIWGWATDQQLLKQQTQAKLQGEVAAKNSTFLKQLSQASQTQQDNLTDYEEFLEARKDSLDFDGATLDDVTTSIQFLQQQAAEQEKVVSQYSQLTAIAETQRQQNQQLVDWHNSRIKRWEVIGTKRERSLKTKKVYGWVHHPEHIPPRNQAQQFVNQAAHEKQAYQQLTAQAQQQLDGLKEQIRQLQERRRDWDVFKQGIEYEIAASELRLQGQTDLLALHEPVQQQKLETLNLQIQQTETELNRLQQEQLPTQQDLTDKTEQRLQDTQSQWQASQQAAATAQDELQNLLELSGFLLPYRERLTVINTQKQRLEDERVDVQLMIQELTSQLSQTPSESLSQQLSEWQNYLERLNQRLAWVTIQQEQLALAVADSPERLAISGLIQELSPLAIDGVFNPERMVAFLESIEGSGSHFLSGFDNLSQRLTRAQAEQEKTTESLLTLQEAYRELGLTQADLLDKRIPGKEEEIGAKEQEIIATHNQITNTQKRLTILDDELEEIRETQAHFVVATSGAADEIASTQSRLTEVNTKIGAKENQIQEQQAILQGYQNQINQANATVTQFEQERKKRQNFANYWNSQIPSYFWSLSDQDKKLVLSGHRINKHLLIYNSRWNKLQQTTSNWNLHQAAANNAAKQRDTAQVQAQQLKATLQPKIAVANQRIATLNQEKQPFLTQKQAIETELASQTQQFNQLQQQLQGVTASETTKQSQIQQQQQRLSDLTTQRQTQQQQRETLLNELANLNQQQADIKHRLIDKYRHIELTENYLSQVNAEITRLEHRLDLLNQAGILEQAYQDHWHEFQQAIATQTTAQTALSAIREAGKSDRELFANLQSQLSQVNTTLTEAKTLQESIGDNQANVELIKLQLENQNLLLTSLSERDTPLATQQAYYLNQAQTHLQTMWYWNGKTYAYNPGEAAAYRANLQHASFIAEQRNQAWQQRQDTLTRINELKEQIATQNATIRNQVSELATLGEIPQLEAEVAQLQDQINTVSQRLTPLQVQETQQVELWQNAITQAENLRTELVQTTALQAEALKQLIGFGVLASESDVDFFATQVEPQVKDYIQKLRTRIEELDAQVLSAKALTTNADELEALLNQAITSLTPLRQQQELEIRQQLDSNQIRLEALELQRDSEQVTEEAIAQDTVLGYAQLNDQVRRDLTQGVSDWTTALLEGHQQTKELGKRQQQLSNSVDTLIAKITENLAAPNGNYNQSASQLRDGITTLGIISNRADSLESSATSTQDAIAQLKLHLEQDAQLWAEIAPIVTRYGIESEQIKAYQQHVSQLNELANQYEQQRQQHQAYADWWHQQISANGLKFDPTYYLAQNPDVAAAVRKGKVSNAWEHFRKYGQFEGRSPNANFDNKYYLNHNPDVAKAVRKGVFRSGVEHFVKYGQYERRIHNPQAEQQRNAAQATADSAAQQRDAHLQARDNAKKVFLANYSNNGTAIHLLQEQTLSGNTSPQQISTLINTTQPEILLNADAIDGRNPNQALFNLAQAKQAEHEAQGYAALSQADWYEQQATYHWAKSRKNGPTWTERRRVKGRSGKKHWETITHVDHDWILWNTYHHQTAPQLRQQGISHLTEADKWRKEKERLEPLVAQWSAANDAANLAEPPIDAARNLFAQLDVARESIPGEKAQLASLENVLPIIQQQLEAAQIEADSQNAKVRAQWDKYDTDSEEYQDAIADILQRRGELNRNSLELQQQLAESEKWVERQTVALSVETLHATSLQQNLQQQRDIIASQIRELAQQGVTVEGLDELYSKDAQLEKSLQLLTNKVTILTAQQTALTQKRTLLTAQNEVILAEQKLLDAYTQDPDADYSTLQQQLQDTRAALAEAQRLAEQAEAASQALTAPLQQIQTELLAENDQHLQAAKAHQQVLKALVEATQLNANYTLQAAQKQHEVNSLEFQIIQRLQEATAAGSQEAKQLLDVAKYNDMATAAEIYYRDYKDLASDRGGCAGGAGRASDKVLANQYYQEMLANRELQRRAQAQANAFKQAKETAQNQIKVLQSEQELAAQLLNELNTKITETQSEREEKEQELAIAQVRLDGITRIREQTEQTFTQLVTLEKLNLAQAQLEQDIAQARQIEIEQAVQQRMERDRLEVERQRLETTAKIEQLRQLQAENELRRSLNQVRGDLGLTTLEPREDSAQLATQMASLLASLKELETQNPELPDDVKALLAEARGDIHLALQGKEAAAIQDNLIKAMEGLIGQIQQYQTEINRLDLEEQWDSQLLQTAQQDLQGASQQLLKELQRSAALQGEQAIINPLYLEVLNKVALAEQAVDISQELAAQSQDILSQIIKQRVEQRKARKKAFWQKILGIIQNVIGILGTILSFTPLAPLGIALTAANAGISAIQSIVNGDWLGGIFNIVMAGVNAITGGMTQVLGEAATAVRVMKTLQSIASSAFSGVRSLMSGESIMGFLQILGSVASAATAGLGNFINQCSEPLQKVMLSVVQSLQQAPQMIYGGIKAIENGDWLNAIGNFFNGALAIGQSFASNFNTAVAGILENISKVGNTALYLGNAIKDGGIEGWLSGLDGILDIWKKDITGLVDKISGKEECECPPQPECDPCATQEIGHLNPEDIPLSERQNVIPIYINGINTSVEGYYDNITVINEQLEALGLPPISLDTYNKSGVENKLWEKIPIIGNLISHLTDIFQSAIQGTTPLSTIEGMQFENSVRSQIESLSQQYPDKKFLLIVHSQGNFFGEDIARHLPREIQEKTTILSLAPFTDYNGIGSQGVFNVGGNNPQAPVNVEYLLRDGDFSDNLKFLSGIAIPNNQANLPDIGNMMENHTLENYVNTDAFRQAILRLFLPK
jgi:hypothetical protein